MTFLKSSTYTKIKEENHKCLVPIPLSVCVGLLLRWQTTQLGRFMKFHEPMEIRMWGGFVLMLHISRTSTVEQQQSKRWDENDNDDKVTLLYFFLSFYSQRSDASETATIAVKTESPTLIGTITCTDSDKEWPFLFNRRAGCLALGHTNMYGCTRSPHESIWKI